MPWLTPEDSDTVHVAATSSSCRHLSVFTRFLAEEGEETEQYPAIEPRAVARCTFDGACRYQRSMRPGEIYSVVIPCCTAFEALALNSTHNQWTE